MRNWTQLKLGDVITLKRGFDLPTSERENGKYPIVSSSGVTDWHKNFKVKAPGVVTGRYGTIGQVYYISDDFWPLNTTLFVEDFKSNNPRFISYFLQTLDFQAYAAKSAVPGINRNDLHLADVKIPDIYTQLQISEILSTYDNLIENNNRRIAILEEMAHRLYRNEVQETDETCLLGEVLTFRRGKNITKATICEGDVPVVAGGLQPAYYNNKANAKAPVLTVSASGANAGYVNLYHVDIWASDCSFIDANNSDNVFFYFVCMKEMQEQITFMQRGSAQPHVYPDDLGRLVIPCLPHDSVVNLNKTLSDIFNTVGNLTKKNENLRKTRDLLLPRLISGDIDVSKIEIPVEDMSQ